MIQEQDTGSALSSQPSDKGSSGEEEGGYLTDTDAPGPVLEGVHRGPEGHQPQDPGQQQAAPMQQATVIHSAMQLQDQP